MAQSRRMMSGKKAGANPQPFGAKINAHYGTNAVPAPATIAPTQGLAPVQINPQANFTGRRMMNNTDFATRLGQALGGVQ